MAKHFAGDLIWIPDGTKDYIKRLMVGIPIKGPACGLVLRVSSALARPSEYPIAPNYWLEVQVGDKTYMINEKDVKKINSEEKTHGQVCGSYTTII